MWAWARIPDLLGDAVDLADTERVMAIVATVEAHEFGEAPPLPGGAYDEPTPERKLPASPDLEVMAGGDDGAT